MAQVLGFVDDDGVEAPFPGVGCGDLGVLGEELVEGGVVGGVELGFELRCIFVESQPIDHPYFAWTIADAATGVMESGETSVRSRFPLQPWAQ
jgi:hypothetical protein